MALDAERVARALPGYEIGDEIGRGGIGVVQRGRHRQLGRDVAIKELPRALAADPEVQRRFKTEARLLATLDHPHIVPIYDYVEEDGLCLLVMELLPGGSVWERFRTDGVSAEAACSIVLASCSALHYAHGKGILHRDVKPDNLLCTATGSIKVSDFGIAKVVGGTASMATRTGNVLGTPAYMAPEQALGDDLTPATDVYALGTVLYELLSGRLPFVHEGNAVALLYRHVHDAPMSLADVAPDLSPALVDATMRAIARDPGDRFQSAEEFGVAVADAAARALGPGWVRRSGVAVMAAGPIGARVSSDEFGAPAAPPPPTAEPTTVVPRAPAPPTIVQPSIPPDGLVPVEQVLPRAAPAPAAMSPTSRVRGRRGRPLLLAAAVVVVILAVAVAAVVVATRSDDSTKPPAQGQAPSVAATIDLGQRVDHLAAGSDGIFVTQPPGKQFVRIDPRDNTVVATVALPNAPHSIAAGAGAVWTTASDAPVLLRTPAGTQDTASVPVGGVLHEIALDGPGTTVWGTLSTGIVRVDGTTLGVTTIAGGAGLDGIAVGGGAVWVADRQSGSVLRVDPTTNAVVATIAVGQRPEAIGVGAGAVWVANAESGTVSRIDPATNAVTTTIDVGGAPVWVVAGSGAVWITEKNTQRLLRLDPATNRITGDVKVGKTPDATVVANGSVWVANNGDHSVTRVDPGS